MPSRDRLLFASMLVTPSTLSFEQPTSEKIRFIVVAAIASAVMLIGAVATLHAPKEQQTKHPAQLASSLPN